MIKQGLTRFIIIAIVALMLMSLLIVRLGTLTIAEGAERVEQAESKSTREITVSGTRGRILDKNGTVLAYSRTCYNVEFLRNADNRTNYDSAMYTESIIKAIDIIERGGGKTIDTSYIVMDENGNIVYDWGVTNEEAVAARYKNFRNAMGFSKDDISAEEAYLRLRRYWFIPEDMSFEQAKKVISIRQEVLLNNYRAYEPVTIAYDVSMDVIVELEIRRDELVGIQTSQSTTRVYPRGTVAAHIVGYMNKSVSKEMMTEYGYSANDYVGVSGVESTMESYLTGATNEHHGSRVIEVNKNGTEIRQISYTPPTDGNDVILTIDLPLQIKTEQALENAIKKIAEEEKQLIENDENGKYSKLTDGNKDKINTASSGAIVVFDVKNGNVLALASYPSYDPNWFMSGLSNEQFDYLFNSDEAKESTPMRNKAISSKLAPGSVFKPVTGLAGLMEGVVRLDERIDDKSPYIIVNEDGTRVEKNAPRCHVTDTSKHAQQDITAALTNSCNYYFYEVANRLGIDRLNDWAGKVGLTSNTGIQLTGESTGIIGGQKILYDNEATLDMQKTSLPQLVFKSLCNLLKGIQELRDVETDEESIKQCAIRIMELQDGSLDNTGPDIRRIMSEELGIPEGTSKNQPWVSQITSILSELQWKATLTIRTGIGQGVSLVTPIEIARYFAAIANRGTVYNANIVDRVIDEGGNIVYESEPEIFNELSDVPSQYWDAIQEGLKGVVSPEDHGTAAQAFSREFANSGYLARISGKTGTAQVGTNTIDIQNTSWFVAYTERDNPEIAIVVCIPNGYKGSRGAYAIEEIVKYYLGRKDAKVEGNLVGINDIEP